MITFKEYLNEIAIKGKVAGETDYYVFDDMKNVKEGSVMLMWLSNGYTPSYLVIDDISDVEKHFTEDNGWDNDSQADLISLLKDGKSGATKTLDSGPYGVDLLAIKF